MIQLSLLLHAGPAHEGGPACERVHCWGCGRDGPERWAMSCGECFHSWRWKWLLVPHDAWKWWKVSRQSRLCLDMGYPSLRLWQRIRFRRPSEIWVCPCCAHDL